MGGGTERRRTRQSRIADPRGRAATDTPHLPPRVTQNPEALIELHRFCKDGRLYDVEDWITAGRPLQVAGDVILKGRRTSALSLALEAGNFALAQLLLANGYDPNLEHRCPLDVTLRDRRHDLLDLLLAWGADPHRVDRCDLFDTYDGALFTRFYDLGVDLAAGHELAATLAISTRNRPLYGFVKRHRSHDAAIVDELQRGLVQSIEQDRELGISLCLWAGADPHARPPEDPARSEDDYDPRWTPIEHAVLFGKRALLERFGVDPARDDVEHLHDLAHDSHVVEFLCRIALPTNPSRWLAEHARSYPWREDFSQRPHYVLDVAFRCGLRWTTATPEEIGEVRRQVLKAERHEFEQLVRTLTAKDHCAPEILKELARTPKFRERLRECGFLPPDPAPTKRRREPPPPPTGARQVRSRLGIELPKVAVEPLGPAEVYLGARGCGRFQEIDRRKLFDIVWSEPVDTLAARWGLSGRGLGKACARLAIPVPPRGYWARRAHGQRPRVPRLPPWHGKYEPRVFVLAAPPS